MNSPHLIVGTGLDGIENTRRDDQFELWSTLAQHGFYAEPVSFLWPRDGYVFFNERYTRETEHGRCGEGGCFLEGKDFLLASDTIRLPHKPFHKADPDELREYLEKLYGGRVIIFPSEHTEEGNHIDFCSLLLPTSNTLIIDAIPRGRVMSRFESMLADAQLTLRVFNSDNCGVYHPLNALALSKEDHDIVFFDGKTEGLAAVLESCGAEPVPVALKNDSPHGKIHCATNTMQGSNPHGENTLGLMFEDGYALAFLFYAALRKGNGRIPARNPDEIVVMLDTKSRVEVLVKEELAGRRLGEYHARHT